jgi:NADH-quinone oxidoreductase subunit N
MFQLSDIPRLLPEILLLVLALMVLGSDVFERWARSAEGQRERVRAAASLTTIGLAMVLVTALLQSGYLFRVPETADANPFWTLLRNLQSGGPSDSLIGGAFLSDHLTMVARIMIVLAALITALLSIDSAPSRHPGEYYALIVFATLGMQLMVGARELLLAYLALELTSIPLYILAGYFRGDDRRAAAEAGLKYFLFGAISSGILLYGMSLAYGAAAAQVGTQGANGLLTDFSVIGQLVAGGSGLALLAFIMIIAGLGYKLAVVPFHAWSPDVYVGAPTPVTGFISTASKTAGFIMMLRLLATAFPTAVGSPVFGAEFGGWTSVLALLALVTLVVGNLAALPQTDARRLLAYSSIAHAGFVLLALIAQAAVLPADRAEGTVALIYYLLAYTLTNLAAFGVLAVVAPQIGGSGIQQLNGLARRHLPLALLMALAVLSLAGVPPMAGFFGKFYIFMVGWQSGAQWLVIVAVLTTVVSLYYYLGLLKAMFLAEPPADAAPISVPRASAAALTLMTVGVLLVGIFPGLVLSVLSQLTLL